jgi:phage tail-like protein
MPHVPDPAYHFSVQWGGSNMDFSEVSGLATHIEPIDYPELSSSNKTSFKIQGHAKFANIVLKRGITRGDTEFYQWINTIRMGTVKRGDILISLLDQKYTPVMTWKVHNAWPIKIESGPLNARGNEVAMETIELEHEGLEIVNY